MGCLPPAAALRAASRPIGRPAFCKLHIKTRSISVLLIANMARGSLASTLTRCFSLQQRRWAASFAAAADGRPETYLFMGPPGEHGGLRGSTQHLMWRRRVPCGGCSRPGLHRMLSRHPDENCNACRAASLRSAVQRRQRRRHHRQQAYVLICVPCLSHAQVWARAPTLPALVSRLLPRA